MMGGNVMTYRTCIRWCLMSSVLLAGLGPVEPAVANPEERGEERRVNPLTQLALARICVSEAGFQVETPDCAAIHRVLVERRGRGSLLRIMRLYSDSTFDREREDRRRWIAWLHPSGKKPRGWPEETTKGTPHPSWKGYRSQWLAVYEHAGAILRGEVEPPCERAPHHWGMRGGIDLENAREGGWNEVDCGDTMNAFWRVPRRAKTAAATQPR